MVNEILVKEAVDLYIETLPLASTNIETESAKWHDLYSKECYLFTLLRDMTEEDAIEYRIVVKYFTQY